MPLTEEEKAAKKAAHDEWQQQQTAAKIAADDKVRKVIICTGKIYYELLEARTAKQVDDVALIRAEQLYPFPAEELKNEIKKYKV